MGKVKSSGNEFFVIVGLSVVLGLIGVSVAFWLDDEKSFREKVAHSEEEHVEETLSEKHDLKKMDGETSNSHHQAAKKSDHSDSHQIAADYKSKAPVTEKAKKSNSVKQMETKKVKAPEKGDEAYSTASERNKTSVNRYLASVQKKDLCHRSERFEVPSSVSSTLETHWGNTAQLFEDSRRALLTLSLIHI